MMRAEEDPRFAAALDACCQRVQRGESLERCVADHPAEYREELLRLVPMATRLNALGKDPSPEFQARLEQHLLASVDQARQTRRVGLLARLGRFFSAAPAMRLASLALVALLALAGGGVSVVQAADDSLPDSPLYQVKSAREWVELTLARDPEAQVSVHDRQIAQRGGELERAVQAGKARPVATVLAVRLARSVRAMVDRALELRAQGRPQPAVKALAALQAMQRRLDVALPHASRELRPTLLRLRTFLEQQELRLETGGESLI